MKRFGLPLRAAIGARGASVNWSSRPSHIVGSSRMMRALRSKCARSGATASSERPSTAASIS